MTHTDDETVLRTRFARAAADITVGPPPTENDLRTGGERGFRRRRTWRAVAVATAAGGIVAAAAVAANLVGAGPEETAGPPAAAPKSEPPERLRLDCPNRFRSILHLDEWEPEGLAAPADVAMPYVDQPAGESVRVIEREDRTYVWILRPDGTARARLEAMYRARYDGWLLGTVTTCGGERLVQPRDRP